MPTTVSKLSRELNIPSVELRELIAELDLGIGARAIKLNDEMADKIREAIKKKKEEEKERLEELKEEKSKEKKVTSKKVIDIPSTIIVRDFAKLLDLPVTQVISELIKNGVMAAMNEKIDFETATIIAEDLGFKAKKAKQFLADIKTEAEQLSELLKEDKSKLKSRPPIVTVMGHVDHGKTTLLDTIREANVAGEEKGGITQHIGAYQVKKKGKIITFLDTPGHEAFTEMRARGANVTDIVILVVAADDGVKPQTIEAINHAKAAEVPIIVAINKIDKPGANIDRVKKEISEYDLVPEEWGGKTVCVEISAKKKTNIDKLLDIVLLVADMEELKVNPTRKAVGTIIESKLTKNTGPVATVLIQTGTLRKGDNVVVGKVAGVIRQMQDFYGSAIDEAIPSQPVRITGFREVPQVGDILQVIDTKQEAREIAQKVKDKEKQDKLKMYSLEEIAKSVSEGKTRFLNLIIKADVQGSVEAIMQALEQIKSDEVAVRILHKAAGDITESDVMMAKASKAIILGFSVKVNDKIKRRADDEGVQIRIYNVIYELIDDVKKALSGLLEPKIVEKVLAKVKILAIFKKTKKEMIIGGKVEDGKVEKNNVKIKVFRGEKEIGKGNLFELQQEKKKVPEVSKGREAGMRVTGGLDIKEGDIVEVYREEKVARKL